MRKRLFLGVFSILFVGFSFYELFHDQHQPLGIAEKIQGCPFPLIYRTDEVRCTGSHAYLCNNTLIRPRKVFCSPVRDEDLNLSQNWICQARGQPWLGDMKFYCDRPEATCSEFAHDYCNPVYKPGGSWHILILVTVYGTILLILALLLVTNCCFQVKLFHGNKSAWEILCGLKKREKYRA